MRSCAGSKIAGSGSCGCLLPKRWNTTNTASLETAVQPDAATVVQDQSTRCFLGDGVPVRRRCSDPRLIGTVDAPSWRALGTVAKTSYV